jgi:DNA-binding beta-propeller fold protein YncE
MGFSPDHRTIAVVAIGSNAVNFIDTETNSVKHITYVGRSPHEAFYTRDGRGIWVAVRGENYVSVLDGMTYEEKTRLIVPNGSVGLEPRKRYVLALTSEPSGTGVVEPLQSFMTNPAGAAIVNAIGPIRQLRGEDAVPRRYLVILPRTADNHGAAVQVQRE